MWLNWEIWLVKSHVTNPYTPEWCISWNGDIPTPVWVVPSTLLTVNMCSCQSGTWRNSCLLRTEDHLLFFYIYTTFELFYMTFELFKLCWVLTFSHIHTSSQSLRIFSLFFNLLTHAFHHSLFLSTVFSALMVYCTISFPGYLIFIPVSLIPSPYFSLIPRIPNLISVSFPEYLNLIPVSFPGYLTLFYSHSQDTLILFQSHSQDTLTLFQSHSQDTLILF